jgi:hypothetical protein
MEVARYGKHTPPNSAHTQRPNSTHTPTHLTKQQPASSRSRSGGGSVPAYAAMDPAPGPSSGAPDLALEDQQLRAAIARLKAVGEAVCR